MPAFCLHVAIWATSRFCPIWEKEHRNGIRAFIPPSVARAVLYDDVAALEMNGFGVIKLQPNLAVVHNGVVDGICLVHRRIFFFKVFG